MDDSPFTFTDSRRQTRTGSRGLVPETTVLGGSVVDVSALA
jgi:hypothetical protein